MSTDQENPKAEKQMPQTQRYRVDQLLRLACGILKISPDTVLRRARLPASYLSVDDRGATAEEYFALWSAMEICYGKGDLAHKLGTCVAHGPFVPAFFAFSCSPDVRTGVERLCLFKPLVGPLKIFAEARMDTFELQICPTRPGLQMPTSLAQSELVLFLELFRTHTATHIVPLEVALPDPSTASEDFFGCKPIHSLVPNLVLSAGDARLPLISENSEMWSVFEPDLRRQLAEKLAVSGIRVRLRNALLEAIPSGDTSSAQLASRLHMSKRSLQRRLREEGTSFQQVLDETRADLARHYLGHTLTPLDEVSYLLGYSSSASFFRAFQSWFGMTPANYRRSHLAA